ncbi:MAG: formyltransferase family protein, partial [Pseudomonadota bacterium]
MTNKSTQLRIVVMSYFPEFILAPLLNSPHKLIGLISFEAKKGLLKTTLRHVYWLLTRFTLAPNNEKICQKNNIAYRIESGKLGDDLSNWLEDLSADIMILYSAPMIPQKIVDTTKIGCLNIHPSLLPKYRGPRPIVWMAKDYDLMGGASIFFIDKGSDTGNIVNQ